jgi:hypothetical protein
MSPSSEFLTSLKDHATKLSIPEGSPATVNLELVVPKQ